MESESMEIIKYLIYDFKNFIYLFLNNKKLEPESMEIIEVKLRKKIPESFTGMVKYPDGEQQWWFNGKLHREDGPAIIYPDGTQIWYFNGELHRKDGPAIIYPSGTQFWYLNDELHREDGPAVIWPDGTQEWYLNGEEMTPMELFEKLSDEQKEKALWNLNQWR